MGLYRGRTGAANPGSLSSEKLLALDASHGHSKDGHNRSWLDQGLNAGTTGNNLPRLQGSPLTPSSLRGFARGDIAYGGRSSLWITTQATRDKYETQRWQMSFRSRIQVVLADREGSLWIGTNGGLARWDEGKLQRLPVNRSAGLSLDPGADGGPRGNLW